MKGKKLLYFGLIVLAFPGYFTASAQTFVPSDLLIAPGLSPNFGHDDGVTTLNFQATVLAGMHKQIAAWGSQNAEVEIELVDLDLGISLGTWPSEPPRYFSQEAPSNQNWIANFRIPVAELPRHLGSNELHLGFIAKLYTENLAAGLPCSDTAEAKVELPPATWLHLDFGDFRVAELNRMGKPWDYKLILGTDAPEFYWQLLRGETMIFSAEEQKCQPEPDFHYEQTSGYWFKYVEGDRYVIEVRENDDIKTELAGSFPLPAIRNNLPYNNETLAFDQISEAHLQLEATDFDTLSWVSGMEVKEIRIEKGQYKLLLKWKGTQPDIPYDWSAYLQMHLLYGSRNLFLMTGYEDESWSWEAGEPVNFELDKGITLTFDTLANFNPDSLRLVVDTYAAQADRRDFFNRTTLAVPWMTPRKHVTTIAYLIVGLALLGFLVIIVRSFRK